MPELSIMTIFQFVFLFLFFFSHELHLINSLWVQQTKKRPSTDFMEVVQKDITPSMRAILIDWLVEVKTLSKLHIKNCYVLRHFMVLD